MPGGKAFCVTLAVRGVGGPGESRARLRARMGAGSTGGEVGNALHPHVEIVPGALADPRKDARCGVLVGLCSQPSFERAGALRGGDDHAGA
jgi:hypothetical protein